MWYIEFIFVINRIYFFSTSANVLAFWRIFRNRTLSSYLIGRYFWISDITSGYQTLFLGISDIILYYFWKFWTLMFDIFETLFSQLLNRRAFESPFVMLFVNLSIVIRYEMKKQKVQRKQVLWWQIWGNVYSFVFMLKDRLFWIVINVSSFKWKLLSVDGLWEQHQFRKAPFKLYFKPPYQLLWQSNEDTDNCFGEENNWSYSNYVFSRKVCSFPNGYLHVNAANG